MLKFHCFYFLSSRTNELDEVHVLNLRLSEVSQLEPEDVLVLMEVFGFQAVGENNIFPLQDFFVLGLDCSPCQHVSPIRIVLVDQSAHGSINGVCCGFVKPRATLLLHHCGLLDAGTLRPLKTGYLRVVML